MDKDLELQLLKQIEEVNMQKQQESTVPKTLNNNVEIRVRPYKSKFTGKLLHNGIVVDSFNNSEEYKTSSSLFLKGLLFPVGKIQTNFPIFVFSSCFVAIIYTPISNKLYFSFI